MRPTSETHSAFSLRSVTPHATNPLPDGPCRALYINDAGSVTVAVVALEDTSPVVLTVSGPCWLEVAAKAVRVTGTTATGIIAAY